ncbi:glycosyltransferase family 4 protein [Mucilaginibacter arboris]|uniref:Glycosyltransferase n=1 Tax=Mucilaginibacter arboris TaxID=2682090 RepID=A0A7K1STM7_9SPHI|nr:glycosyltransferase family 4 protein [Mucilaginibacter arboris]MVN20617.1 glycosyltransferase [Mucilaginibacter arboris]
MKRLAIITTHPIQYYAPVFSLLHQQKKIEIKVFYTLGEAGLKQTDPGFGRSISWDIPLLQGYPYQFQKNTAKNPGSDRFLGIKNPDLIKEIKSWKADAVLVYGWAYLAHLKAICYFKGKIPVFFRGDSTLLNRPSGWKATLKNLFLKWVYKQVDHAFFVGKNNKDYFKKFGLKPYQLTFAPHAIDNERFAEDRSAEAASLRQKLGIEDEGILILFAGKFEAVKNAALLLEGLERLNQQNTHLLLVGNGPLEKKLQAKKRLLKTASNIHFLDFQNQSAMPFIYQSCDLFCLSSNSETWGLAVNEAMACGKAVLVSDKVGCAADLVLEEENGAIFQSGNADDLTQKLQFLCQDKALLKQYGQASAQIIKNWNFINAVKAMQEKIVAYA